MSELTETSNMVFRSRFTPGVKGGQVKWEAGQIVNAIGTTSGWHARVKVLTGQFVSHPEMPGIACIEVQFIDEGDKMWCIDADALQVEVSPQDQAIVRQMLREAAP